MRPLVVALVLLALSASAAFAHATKYAWTAAKAEVMLTNDATIPLPTAVEAQLEADLRAQLAQFQSLSLTAQQDRKDWLAAETFGNYMTRFREALEKVRSGLSFADVQCKGLGPALKGKRYKHFSCAATSVTLEIPTVELGPPADGSVLPTPVEGDPAVYGPYSAAFTLHVLGATRSLSKRTG